MFRTLMLNGNFSGERATRRGRTKRGSRLPDAPTLSLPRFGFGLPFHFHHFTLIENPAMYRFARTALTCAPRSHTSAAAGSLAGARR